MDITQVSVIHHVGIVLALLWILSYFNCCHPAMYFLSLIYLYQIHEIYVLRLRRKLQFEERKQANQRRVLSDSETVRWLNHAVEKIWPICMEQIASQKILLPIIPWFLEKYKPWTAKEAVVQNLYLGRNPPMFTEIRALHPSTDDDHLVLELGINFLSANDMSAIICVKLRKRLGFGIWAKLHITGMHVEGKVLIGIKFLHEWPFLGRLRVCFVEPPYFQMTAKPIFNHGVDVTELPGIAGWLDKLLAIAFEQTLVEHDNAGDRSSLLLRRKSNIEILRSAEISEKELSFGNLFFLQTLFILQPNMLVVDVEKFASSPKEKWFAVDEKETIAYAKVEIIEGADMKPSDLNGLADPYVKGQLGLNRFRTKTQKKTLAPKWQEEYRIPICTWDSPNKLALEVFDKDHFHDDAMGDCSISISALRGGQRHDMWLSLQNIKMGRLHLAVTVHDVGGKGVQHLRDEKPSNKKEGINPVACETNERSSNSMVSSEHDPKMKDKFEPINIDGQQQTGVWVHHPGSDVSANWEPRKAKSRKGDTQIHNEDNGSTQSSRSPHSDGNSSNDKNSEGNRLNRLNIVRSCLGKVTSVFHMRHANEDASIMGEAIPTPRVNLRAVNEKGIGVNFIVQDNVSEAVFGKDPKADKGSLCPDRNGGESPRKGNAKDMAKSILKHAGRYAHDLKHVLSRKASNESKGDLESVSTEMENSQGSDASNMESLSTLNKYSPKVQS